MVSPAIFDLLAALTLLGVALLGAYAPMLLYKLGNKEGSSPSRSLAYVLGNMLSAGVMISAGFVHLLGAAVKELDPTSVFPLAPFLCGLGFILTLIADYAAELLSSKTGWKAMACHGDGSSAASAPNGEHDGVALQNVTVHGTIPEEGEENERESKAEQSPGKAQVGQAGSRKQAFQVETMQNGNGLDHREHGEQFQHSPRNPETGQTAAGHADSEPLFGAEHISSAGTGTLDRTVSDGSTGRSLETLAATLTAQAPGIKQVSFVTAVLMAVALCFHSILEGMAMGAQGSVVDTLHIFIAIFAHKGLAAYALGSSLVDSGTSQKRFWAVIAAFSLATPAGIALGRVVASYSQGGAASALSALASGTFLYVAFMEVIPKEMQSQEHGLAKLGMLCLGFGAMSLLAIWA